MKTMFLIMILSLTWADGCSNVSDDQAITQLGQHDQVFIQDAKVALKYLLYLPEGYSKDSQAWPVIMFLHGAGERGDNLEKIKAHGPPMLVENGKKMPFIVVSPQCPKGKWWVAETLNLLLEDIITRYNADPERIYLTGLSMGGFGTWDLGSAHPERFAAIAPICGGGNPGSASKLKNTPIWVFHGAKDNVVPIKKSQKMVDAVKAVGGNVKFTIYPEAGHNSWTTAYNNQDLYDWLLKHSKK